MTNGLAVVPKEKGSGGAEPGTNGEVTLERYEQIATRLSEFKSTTHSTWPEIAAQIGDIQPSTLTTFAGGKYPLKHARNLCEAVERFFAVVDERTGLITSTVYVETSLAKRMNGLIKKAVLLTKMVEIAAESGTGKTKTLQHWWAQNPRAIYIQANATFKTSVGSTFPLLAKLMRAMGRQVFIGQKPVLYDTLCDELRGTGRPLIIDRAQWVQAGQRDMLCDLHEDANVPIIFGIASDDREAGAFSANAGTSFKSRLLREELRTSHITAGDVDLIAEAFGGIDVARDAAPILLSQSQLPGGFRRLVNILQLAQTFRHAGQRKVGKDHVIAAVKELHGGLQ
jgi:DNA transposition AAA+ family ATPase